MLARTAFRILRYEKPKFLGAVAAMALAGFLIVFQWAVYYGYRRDTTVVLDAFDADFWVIPKGQLSFDGFSPMDDSIYWQAKNLPEIDAVCRVAWGYASWRLPRSTSLDCIQILGVEFDSGIQLDMQTDCANPAGQLRPDGSILVARSSQRRLEVPYPEIRGTEILGRQATVVGFVDGINLFTTYGFVLTDFENARVFLRLPSNHVTHIACKCRPEVDVRAVIGRLQATGIEHDILTTEDFRRQTSRYWQSNTGVGPILLFPSILAACIGFLMVMLTFYISTLQKLPLYASLKALGAANHELALLLAIQILSVTLFGCFVAALCLWPAIVALQRTNISAVVTPQLVVSTFAALLLCSALGGLLSFSRIMHTDPGNAFR
jgi:putative ABC transport system permease protein